MRRVLMLILLAVGLSVVLTDSTARRPAYACTGPNLLPLNYYIRESDYAFYGRVVEVDSIGMNAIFEVESYLTDAVGQKYVAIQQDIHREIQGKKLGYHSCGGVFLALRPGDKGIFFANRTPERVMQVGYPWYIFSHESSTRDAYYVDENEETSEYKTYTQNELLDLIEQLTGITPSIPDNTQNEILPAPMLIMTDNNSAYMLPVDMQEPVLLSENVLDVKYEGNTIALFTPDEIKLVEFLTYQQNQITLEQTDCLTSDCLQISAAGLYLAYQQDSSTVTLCYSLGVFCEGSRNFSGIDFSLVPSGEFLTFWNDNEVIIYDIGVAYPNYNELISFDYEGEITKGLWSENGELFAFSDGVGLKIWNRRVAMAAPELIIQSTAEIKPIPISFSARNTYLGVYDGNEHYTLDLITGMKYPFGKVSPDEHHLAVTYVDESGTNLYVCDLYDQCEDKRYIYPGITEWIWLTDNRLLLNGCVIEICGVFFYPQINYGEEFLQYGNFPYYETKATLPWWEGTSLIYHPIRETIALINDPSNISITFGIDNPRFIFYDERYVTLDLSDEIDGEIVSIEWLPSYFYEDTFRRYVP